MSTQPDSATEARHPVDMDVEWPLSRRGDVVPETCAWLREHRPVARVRTLTGEPAWLVSTHELAGRVLHDDVFSLSALAEPGARLQYAPVFPETNRRTLQEMQDAGLREAIMRAVSPRVIKEASGGFRLRAEALLDELVAEGPPVDLRARFTDPYTVSVMSAVLGMPDDHGRVLMNGLDIAIMTVPHLFEGAQVNYDKGTASMAALLRAPGAVEAPGLLGALARLRAEQAETGTGTETGAGTGTGTGTGAGMGTGAGTGARTETGTDDADEQMARMLHGLFVAGAVSSSVFLLLSLLHLMQRPDQLRWLRAHPEAMESAVEELLRFNLAIGDGLPRVATRDTELGGVPIAAGDLVLVLVEGANYDPAVFEDPLRLDLTRGECPHLSFGSGQGYCPATTLARTHASVALSAVLERLPDLRLAIPESEINWRSGWVKRTPERLPVLW
ncbi:cytochrome P450 [Streptomyces sp. NPDC003077]|uniref:cytochrome P450 n=1 Tax=Streptomyces sp. NPDC003077 TaxID=3154443 RepID=UPI0033A34C2B